MTPSTVRSLALAILFLAWVGFLAIAVSGALAAAMQTAFGAEFVAGDIPGVTYTADRCADLEEYAPAGTTCAEAAALHHADETVTYRLAAGVLGLILFVAWFFARRRGQSRSDALPPGLLAGSGATLFGVVGLALLAQGLELLVLGPTAGEGADLSAGIVSLVVAAAFAMSLYRTLAGLGARAAG
jgi:hypothetical protein